MLDSWFHEVLRIDLITSLSAYVCLSHSISFSIHLSHLCLFNSHLLAFCSVWRSTSNLCHHNYVTKPSPDKRKQQEKHSKNKLASK